MILSQASVGGDCGREDKRGDGRGVIVHTPLPLPVTHSPCRSPSSHHLLCAQDEVIDEIRKKRSYS